LGVAAGGAVPGVVVYANCGAVPWVAGLTEDALAGVKLGAVSDTVMHTWEKPRVLLPRDIAPGEAVRIRWEGTAPLVNGAHPCQWQLLDEWVRWIDAPTPVNQVEVSGGYGPFVVHPRSDWETAEYPVDGSDLDLLDLEYITIHYNGATQDLDGDDDVYSDQDTMRQHPGLAAPVCGRARLLLRLQQRDRSRWRRVGDPRPGVHGRLQRVQRGQRRQLLLARQRAG
jgi:hypothetical protein